MLLFHLKMIMSPNLLIQKLKEIAKLIIIALDIIINMKIIKIDYRLIVFFHFLWFQPYRINSQKTKII